MERVDWLRLPPLPSLKAFEATARLGGFSAAARALNVTHAAVAQQVRALEAHLGVALVHRSGRAIALTADGADLAGALSDGFGTIQAALDTVRAGSAARPVTITLTSAFASNWLMPRLGRFWAAHPDIAVSLRPDSRVLDLRRERIDFGIRYGMGAWPDVEATFLTEARYVIVGAPQFFDGDEPILPERMAKLPWVLEPDWPEQRSWLLSSTGLDIDALSVTPFATEDLALLAARQGYGLHVSSSSLVEEDIRRGTLRIAFDSPGGGPAYYIVTPPGELRRSAREVIRWLSKNT